MGSEVWKVALKSNGNPIKVDTDMIRIGSPSFHMKYGSAGVEIEVRYIQSICSISIIYVAYKMNIFNFPI